jgi:ATP-dependent Clp protease ATP-binding subunit ClpA
MLEHLLLALLQDLEIREVLSSCGANVERLHEVLERLLAEVQPVEGKRPIETHQTIGIERVLERAAIHAPSSEKKQMESIDVLIGVYGEQESQVP